MKCYRCCNEIEDNLKFCPKCGLDFSKPYIPEEELKEIKTKNSSLKKTLMGIAMAINMCIGFGLLMVVLISIILCSIARTTGTMCDTFDTNVRLICGILDVILPIIIIKNVDKYNKIITIPFILLMISDIIIIIFYFK